MDKGRVTALRLKSREQPAFFLRLSMVARKVYLYVGPEKMGTKLGKKVTVLDDC